MSRVLCCYLLQLNGMLWYGIWYADVCGTGVLINGTAKATGVRSCVPHVPMIGDNIKVYIYKYKYIFVGSMDHWAD